MGTESSNYLTLVEFDERFLEMSWVWLNIPEIRILTMSKEFTREEQVSFFNSLAERNDYYIWGIMYGSHKQIGAMGIKNCRNGIGEYWGYIGEREFWGRGLGKCLMTEAEKKARELNLSKIELWVSKVNKRAISLYKKSGFSVDFKASTNDCYHMMKSIV